MEVVRSSGNSLSGPQIQGGEFLEPDKSIFRRLAQPESDPDTIKLPLRSKVVGKERLQVPTDEELEAAKHGDASAMKVVITHVTNIAFMRARRIGLQYQDAQDTGQQQPRVRWG